MSEWKPASFVHSEVRPFPLGGSAVPPGNCRAAKLVVLVDDTDAVYPVRVDPTFSDENWISMGGLPGANNWVNAAVADGSGNLYIGGDFTLVGDGIAKWDGSRWSALGSGMDGIVGRLAVSGSDLYAGGSFTTAGGKASAYLTKAEIVSPPYVVPPQFLDGSDFVVRFGGSPGITYTIEYTEDLSPANWRKADNLTAPSMDEGLGVGVFEFRDGITTATQRFYRAVSPAY